MSERLGPETRAIIDAIYGLRKSAHETTNYKVINIDLAVARVNVQFPLEGWFDHLTVAEITGTASMRLNEATKDSINLTLVRSINSPIKSFYITNVAQAGADLVLHIGGDANFTVDAMRTHGWGRDEVFILYTLDENGAGGTFEPSYAEADTPVQQLGTFVSPIMLRAGKINRIHVRLNPTNAVTYILRLYTQALGADYQSGLNKIFDSTGVFAGADNIEYDVVDEDIPLRLLYPGVVWFALEWTGAPGVTTGYISISGETKG